MIEERKKVYTTKNVFSRKSIHTIIDANINFYTAPFVHPKRNMREHDFIYLLGGEWSLGQNGTTYELKEDSLLILFAGNTHYGVTPCKADTKTMYFHVSCEAGDFFGEMAIFDNLPRSASCIAKDDTVCIAVTKENLSAFIGNCPDMAAKMESCTRLTS